MKKIKISFLLNLLLVLIILLIIFQIIFSLGISNNISALSSSIYNHPFIVTNELKDINMSLNDIQNSLENIQYIRKEEFKYEVGKINLYENKIENSLEIILEKFYGNKNNALDIKSSYDEYKKNVNGSLKKYYINGRQLNYNSILPAYDSLKTKIDKAFVKSVNNADSFYSEIEKEKSLLLYSLYIFIAVSILYAFVFLYVINAQIIFPLKKVISKIIGISNNGEEGIEEKKKQNEIELLSNTVSNLEKVTEDLYKENIERKNAEKMLKVLNGEMKELMASKEKMYSIIAHDLKNPFNSILGLSNYLRDNIEECDKNEIKKIVTNIRDSAENQFELLKNLLDWSRSQCGDISINKEPVRLTSLLDTAIDNVKIMAQKKEIGLVNEVPYNVHIYSDKVIILIILNNLISNAIKFSERNKKIIISAEEDENYVTVKVIDEGCGIEEYNLEKLFDLDKDFIKPGTDGIKGTGLGLTICKELIEKQNGKIWAESVVGKGSTFYFSLPKYLFKSKLSF